MFLKGGTTDGQALDVPPHVIVKAIEDAHHQK